MKKKTQTAQSSKTKNYTKHYPKPQQNPQSVDDDFYLDNVEYVKIEELPNAATVKRIERRKKLCAILDSLQTGLSFKLPLKFIYMTREILSDEFEHYNCKLSVNTTTNSFVCYRIA